MIRVTVVVATLFGVASGVSSPRGGQGQQDYADPTAAAYDALLKTSGSGHQANIYCVATAPYGYIFRGHESDPSPALLSRLSDAHTNLRPASRCVRRANTGSDRFVEDSTGKQLMFVTVSCAHRLEGDTLVFQGAYLCGGRCGAGGTIRVWRAGGVWQARFILERMS
jgi:hypothetical protein